MFFPTWLIDFSCKYTTFPRIAQVNWQLFTRSDMKTDNVKTDLVKNVFEFYWNSIIA